MSDRLIARYRAFEWIIGCTAVQAGNVWRSVFQRLERAFFTLFGPADYFTRCEDSIYGNIAADGDI